MNDNESSSASTPLTALENARRANELAVAEAERVANEVEAQIANLDATVNVVTVDPVKVVDMPVIDKLTVTFDEAQRRALELAERAANVEKLRIE